MLLFHEGLPRSGKSYEAMVEHIIPALKKARFVYARLDGLNYPQIAELAGLSLERCSELLVHLTKEDMKILPTYPFKPGAFIVLDEAQNYWPRQRKPLSPEMIEFVSEHGHKGYDILVMSQTFKSVHTLWCDRVSQKVQFRKQDMIGKPTHYTWLLYKKSDLEKFELVNKGSKEYNKLYFGTYKSFEEGAEGNQLYADKRASIWASPIFRKWLPIFVVCAGFGIYYLWDALGGGGIERGINKNAKPATPQTAKQTTVQPVGAKPPSPVPVVELKRYEKDFVQDLSERYRLRVSAIIKSAKKATATFEWYDESLRVQERLSMRSIVRFGYAVELDSDMETATITKGAVTYVATQFPLETYGQTSERQQQQIQGREPIESSSGIESSVVASRDGYGVLGRAGEGVRQPGIESKTANR